MLELSGIYRLLRPCLFRLPAERAHELRGARGVQRSPRLGLELYAAGGGECPAHAAAYHRREVRGAHRLRGYNGSPESTGLASSAPEPPETEATPAGREPRRAGSCYAPSDGR